MDNIAEVDRSTTTPQQNLLFRNLGDGKFENVTAAMGAGFALRKTSRAAAFGDYDNDGDIDILVTNWNQTVDLLKNEGGNRNNWIQVQADRHEKQPFRYRRTYQSCLPNIGWGRTHTVCRGEK